MSVIASSRSSAPFLLITVMDNTREARVIRVEAKVCLVEADGERFLATPRGQLFEGLAGTKNPVAVGDRVRVSLHGDPVAIEEVLPRSNHLSRVASSHDPREQVLVANVDQLVLVGSLSRPGFSSNRTDRILAACAWHEIPAVLVLNKTDLARDGDLDAIRDTYAAAQVRVLPTCATEGHGLEALADTLKDKVTVLYGASGAGKSTLLNALQPGLNLKVGKTSKYWKSGKHTTTFSELHALDMGGFVIDTPGVRVFRLHDISRAALPDLFPEFSAFESNCRYQDCSHNHEPGCAVWDAVDSGALPPTRYASYLELLEEIDPDAAPPLPDAPAPDAQENG
ncbi:MAG: ribosome small subunit-dependent GTPase A [Planctomycetes bacterium]|nr:ribosome small subunit-dependent GTPase A [Planctomycetota bacterium]